MSKFLDATKSLLELPLAYIMTPEARGQFDWRENFTTSHENCQESIDVGVCKMCFLSLTMLRSFCDI